MSHDYYNPPTEDEREEAAGLHPATRGTYVAGGAFWGSGSPEDRRALVWLVLFLLCPCVVAGVVALFQAASAPAGAMFDQASGHPVSRSQVAFLGLCLTGGPALGAALLWPNLVRRPALRVVWDERGVVVTKVFGRVPIALKWEELLGLAELLTRGSASSILVASHSGRSFSINSWGSGYGELLDALKAHIWTRKDGEGGEPATASWEVAPPTATECSWCGETFPAGTAKCPQCGRPVPPSDA
jgi:hypothetical protein